MDDECVMLYSRLGRHGSQTVVNPPLLQCWVPLSVCFSSVVAWMGLSLARNKEACPISFHIPCSSWYTYHFVFKNEIGRWRTALYVDVRSCFRHLLLFLLDLVPHISQFVVYISHHVRSIMNIMWLSSWYHAVLCAMLPGYVCTAKHRA